jgi:hypothetical protein
MLKKRHWVATVAIALGVSGGAAFGADLANGSGQSCGDLLGTWHFVNNQTGGAPAGILTATWSDGSCTVGPSAVNNKTQHFYCTASGTLQSASTNLPGRLVLSDFSCADVKEPPCDPKKEICK